MSKEIKCDIPMLLAILLTGFVLGLATGGFLALSDEEDILQKGYELGWKERGVMLEIRSGKNAEMLKNDCELFRQGKYSEIILQDNIKQGFCILTPSNKK